MTNNNIKDLHSGLASLQAQLEKLDSASQQIEQVKEIGGTLFKSMALLHEKYASNLNELSIDNNKKREANEKLLKEQLKNNEDATSQLVKDTELSLNQIKKALNENIDKSIKIHEQNSEEIGSHLTAYSEFVTKVEILNKTIESVNFPNRLDKLDNTVSAINLGVQNLQSVVSTSEKNILEKLKENNEGLKAEFKVSKSQLKSTKIIILIFGIISILLILTLIVKAFV